TVALDRFEGVVRARRPIAARGRPATAGGLVDADAGGHRTGERAHRATSGTPRASVTVLRSSPNVMVAAAGAAPIKYAPGGSSAATSWTMARSRRRRRLPTTA